MFEKLGIQLVRLDLPFRLNHVNCFIAKNDDGYVVLDSGLHNKETADRWEEELKDKKVSQIYVSHAHPDHFGYAGKLQQIHQARLSMTEIDGHNAVTAWEKEALDRLLPNYELSGIPKEIGEQLKGNTEEFLHLITPYPKVDHYFQEHEKVQFGPNEYEIIFTPGHSDGLIVFYNEEHRVLLSTDHILPRITPNISYWFHGDPNPLDTYIKSLNKVKKLNADYVIPSHGKPFNNANKRIDEIIKHHDDRLNETLEAIEGNNTIYNICQQLFQFELTVHETRFAVGETLAHLEYLRKKGELVREKVNGAWHYAIK